VELRSLMTSEETRDLSGKSDRSRVNSNTKRVGKSRHVDGGMFTTVAILNKKSFQSLIEFSPATCVLTPVVKFVLVGGERNPKSLALSLRVRGRELEGKRGATVAQADELRMSRGPHRHPGPVPHAEIWSDE